MASKNSGNSETEEDFSFLNIAKTNPAVIKDKVLQERLTRMTSNSGKSEGVKRGRTESTGSPPERSPTPGGAKLGDWMKKIEDTIAAQASEIESLKKTVNKLRIDSTFATGDAAAKCVRERGTLAASIKETDRIMEANLTNVFTNFTNFQANIAEITEAIENSEVKATASVDDLRGTFDVQFKEAAETTEKKIKDSVEAARAETVRTMVNQAKKIEEIRTNFDKQIREAVNQVVKEKIEGADRVKKSAVNGIFFTGLDVIAKREKWQGDITAVVHNILLKIGSAPYYTDVIAVHPRNSPRNSAKNAIIYFQSVYHKNLAAAEIRGMLFREKYVKTGIRDLFNPADVPRSKDLTAKGFELKRRDVISKFRVSNLDESPVMLVAKRGGAYEKVTDVQVEEMLRRSS